MTPDAQLLHEYATTNSQDAFGELVRRHVNLVYSTALRQVGGDAHLAKDVAQAVFTDLARKAGSLSRRASLSGWLYTSARFAAAKTVRAEQRRRGREESFMRESLNEPSTETDWEAIRPVLDDAMHELKEHDREAIVLRYFENRPFAEIGSRLGLNENAARMRVERALEKLQLTFARRGITTSVALAAVISAHAVQVAPAGLAASLTVASLAGAGSGTLTLFGLLTMNKTILGISALVVAGAATTLVVQHQTQARLRSENEGLRQQLEQLSNTVANAPETPVTTNNSLPDAQFRELLRLRGEVGLLRRQTNELAQLVRKPQSQSPARPPAQPAAEEDPKTPDAATRSIFETMARGDWDSFFEKFGEPGVPREIYEKNFDDKVRNLFAGMEILSVGEPTNSFGANMWFVPYKIRLKDGTEKEFRLHVAQDPRTHRWFFKGGL